MVKKFFDLSNIAKVKESGRNVSEYLRNLMKLDYNSPEIIEISYDLQSGEYVENVRRNLNGYRAYTSEIAAHLQKYLKSHSRILDAGCGEMTITSGILNNILDLTLTVYATDISLSRLLVGCDFIKEKVRSDIVPFVSSFFALPFKSNSFDIVYTTHALEPNGGREVPALQELFRVARSIVILFEPSYEKNTDEGRRRMDSLGYIKDLPNSIIKAGAELLNVIKVETATEFSESPLNPTYAYVCKKVSCLSNLPSLNAPPIWAFPGGNFRLEQKSDCFYSPDAMVAFPIIHNIPVLQVEAGVFASALSRL